MKLVIIIRKFEEEDDEGEHNDITGEAIVISWDLKKNAEINHYEVEDPFTIAFDEFGKSIIVQDGIIDIDDRSTQMTTFDFDKENITEAQEKQFVIDEE